MAYFSDEELVDAIRHIFLVTDDHGINERIIPAPRLRKPAGVVPTIGKDEVDIHGDEFGKGYAEWLKAQFDSCDRAPSLCRYASLARRRSDPIAAEVDSSRARSHTSAQIEQLREERAKSISARDTIDQWISTEFEPVSLPNPAERVKRLTSSTSAMLEDGEHEDVHGVNVFERYADFRVMLLCVLDEGKKQFQATSAAGEVRRYQIFLTMAQPPTNIVVTLAMQHNPTVADLIGVACFEYSKQELKPDLEHRSTYDYRLYMCDDGEVEWDLPALKNTDQLARIGFNQLALVAAPRRPTDATDSDADSDYRMTVYFNIPHMTKLELELDPDNTTIEELRNIAIANLNKVRPLQHRAMTRMEAEYTVQRLDCALGTDPDLPLDLLLSDLDIDAVLVMRAGSNREDFDRRRRGEMLFEEESPLSKSSHIHSPLTRTFKGSLPLKRNAEAEISEFPFYKAQSRALLSNHVVKYGNYSLHSTSSTKDNYGAATDAEDDNYTNRSDWRRYTQWFEQMIVMSKKAKSCTGERLRVDYAKNYTANWQTVMIAFDEETTAREVEAVLDSYLERSVRNSK